MEKEGSVRKRGGEKKKIWHKQQEKVLKEWSEIGASYRYMHDRAYTMYNSQNLRFALPVIIISTVTGTANFAQDRFPEDVKEYVVMGIGSLSIIAGIITTINQFLQISELNEGYRAAAISWNKLHNNLKTLIMRHPLDRIEPTQALKLYKDEYDHLCEISPPIVKKVLNEFNSKFKKTNDLSKPEICSKLVPTSIFKMTDVEREVMISKINNKRKNPKIMETFLNLNGMNASEEELDILQNSEDMNSESNNSDINSETNINDGGESNSYDSITFSNSVTEI